MDIDRLGVPWLVSGVSEEQTQGGGIPLQLLFVLATVVKEGEGKRAATVAILTIVYGPWLLLGLPVIALIGWSGVRLAHHTPAQVIAGTPVGALAARPPSSCSHAETIPYPRLEPGPSAIARSATR
ncbi:phosphatase PAP2 family protein [Actinoallomurus sp. NPDC052274]|uniref:phosphatase PAP2 family protein n=1 Tax=Actinoallomurus sp. NPDC052274 TaxID=3155420 RepID=UPI00342AFACE